MERRGRETEKERERGERGNRERDRGEREIIVREREKERPGERQIGSRQSRGVGYSPSLRPV